jgi:hypothetical protein
MRIDSVMTHLPKQQSNMAARSQASSQPDPNLSDGKRVSRHHKPGWVKPTVPVLSSNPASETQSNNNNMPQLTMDGMIAAFGTNNAAYDLNADGIVDLDDFSQFLINGATGFHADGGITSQGIEANLGSNNLAYDLDGDGSVGLSDFTEFLVNYGQNTQNLSAPATQLNDFANQTSSIDQLTDSPMSIRGSSLFGKQAIQLYQQLWTHSGNMPPRQLLSGA